METEKIRILIADSDGQLSRRLSDYMAERGFACRTALKGSEVKELLLSWQPRLVLMDLMLPEMNALDLLEYVQKNSAKNKKQTQFIVMSKHNSQENVSWAIRRGAKDYIVKPFKYEDVFKRIVFHCRSYRHLREIQHHDFHKIDTASLMLHLTDLVVRQALVKAPLADILFNLTRMVSLKMDGVRCSIVHCLDHRTGTVVTSNDDRNVSGLQLDLNKYPEILSVMNSQNPIAIENLEQSTELASIREHLKGLNFNSIIVCPVSRHDKPFGVLSLRMPVEKKQISDNEIRFVEIVSHIVSLVLNSQKFNEISDFWQESRLPPPIPFPQKIAKK